MELKTSPWVLAPPALGNLPKLGSSLKAAPLPPHVMQGMFCVLKLHMQHVLNQANTPTSGQMQQGAEVNTSSLKTQRHIQDSGSTWLETGT